MLLNDIIKYGKRAVGRSELIRFMQGKRLTNKQMILAKCYECEHGYTDGKKPCPVLDCPLHPHHPYSSLQTRKTGKGEHHSVHAEQRRRNKLGMFAADKQKKVGTKTRRQKGD